MESIEFRPSFLCVPNGVTGTGLVGDIKIQLEDHDHVKGFTDKLYSLMREYKVSKVDVCQEVYFDH